MVQPHIEIENENSPAAWTIIKKQKTKVLKKNKYQNEVSLYFFIIWIKY